MKLSEIQINSNYARSFGLAGVIFPAHLILPSCLVWPGEEIETEIREWFEDVMMGVQKKCKDANETTINAEIFKNMNKDVLCEWLEEVWGICDRARDTSVSARRTLNSLNLKGQVISCQSQVIELQQRMLDKKSDELDVVTVAVTTVKESVKSECEGYAEAVKNSCNM